MNCAVPGCVGGAEAQVVKRHFLPKDPKRRAEWLKFCRITEDSPKLRICSLHFPDEAYQTAYRVFGRDRRDWRLNPTAVPTLNLPKTEQQEIEEQFVVMDFDSITESLQNTTAASSLDDEIVEEVVEDNMYG